MPYLLSQLAEQVGAVLVGEDRLIDQVASLKEARPQHITFISDERHLADLQHAQAGAVIVNEHYASLTDIPRLIVDNPYLTFIKVTQLFNPLPQAKPGMSANALIAATARVDPSAEIGSFVTIGANTIIAAGVIIYPGCVIGDNVQIGANSVLYPNVTVYPRTVIGQQVIIEAGAVIGSAGFGNIRDPAGWITIPHIGGTIIEDDVQIGANTTIDRGTLDNTIIRRGARLDNQIQIAHNVEIGEHTAIAACVGIAGSTKIGAYCLIGGAAMISGHLELADHVTILGGTLVAKSISKAGAYSGVYPMQQHIVWRKNAVHVRHLDQLAERVKSIEQQLKALSINE